MNGHAPSIASEQARAFVALVNFGNYRTAADSLHLTREGLRRRLLTLEDRLHVRLYEKGRGRHTNIRLTREGNLFYTKSVQFLEEAKTLTELFDHQHSSSEIKVGISNYVADYHLSSILRDFHRQLPDITIHVTAGTEQQIVSTMQGNPRIKLGICVCDTFPTGLIRRQLFSMSWHFIAQLGHPLLQQSTVTLAQLADEPLIMFQPGCPARQRILEAFRQQSITPNVSIDVTTTQMALNLVEAGIGTAVIPILRPCAIFRGRRVSQVPVSDSIRPIVFALLAQKDLSDDMAALKLMDCIFDQFGHKRLATQSISRDGRPSEPDKYLLTQRA